MDRDCRRCWRPFDRLRGEYRVDLTFVRRAASGAVSVIEWRDGWASSCEPLSDSERRRTTI